MRRVVSVWLPALPTDLVRRHKAATDPDAAAADADAPLVTVMLDGNTRRLGAVDPVAAARGLAPGMKLTEARILVPGLREHPADPAAEAAELHRLAAWCLRYAPLAAPDPPDGLWIDITGSAHLQGGESNLLRDLIRRLTEQGLTARAALAGTPGVAHAMARYAANPTHITPSNQPLDAGLPDDFPIEALRLPTAACDALRRLGVRHVAHIAAIARGPMTRRFGPIVTLRLDQAAGRVFEPIHPIIPAEAITDRLHFVEPLLTADAFATVIDRLTASICRRLTALGQGARRLDLVFERVDGSRHALRVGTARASRDPAHLRRMLAERLETVDPGLGVEAMRLVVSRAEPLAAEQAAASLFAEPVTDLAPLVDRLVSRLGPARVFRLAPVASHVPEDSVQRVAPLTLIRDTWPAGLTRPVRILDPPQPIEAEAERAALPPVAFTWRRVRHRVRVAQGPERITGAWWSDHAGAMLVRDYFAVEDERGRRYWLFRSGAAVPAGAWFLHGFL